MLFPFTSVQITGAIRTSTLLDVPEDISQSFCIFIYYFWLHLKGLILTEAEDFTYQETLLDIVIFILLTVNLGIVGQILESFHRIWIKAHSGYIKDLLLTFNPPQNEDNCSVFLYEVGALPCVV